MIMAEKIALLRKRCGWSQEELAERLGVSRQSVSKWESGGSIPDLDRVVKIAGLFGVSVDYLGKDEQEEVAYTEAVVPAEAETGTQIRRVTAEEADTYMAAAKRTGRGIALGAALCVFSPACLFLLMALAERTPRLSEDLTGGLGTAALLILVAAGVALLILNGLRAAKYEYMETEPLDLEYGVYGIAEKKREEFAPRFRLGIALGVVVIILGIVPLMIAGGMDAGDAAYMTCTSFLFLCVAGGVYLIISVSTVNDSFQKLMEAGDYTPEKKAVRRRLGALPGIYWCAVTGIYLAISFLTMRWDVSWIVWPVAGVLFPAVIGIAKAVVRGSLAE